MCSEWGSGLLLQCLSGNNLPAMQETWEMWVRSLVGRTPWRRAWQPTLVSLPGKFHRQRNLAGYGRTWQKQLSIHTCRQKEAKMIIPLSIMLNTRCFSLNLEEKCGDKQSFRWVVCLVWCRLGHLERHLFIFVFFYGLHLDLWQLPLFKVFFFFFSPQVTCSRNFSILYF